MGFFHGFSRRPEADSERSQKRQSRADFLPRKSGFFNCGDRLTRPNQAENGRPLENC